MIDTRWFEIVPPFGGLNKRMGREKYKAGSLYKIELTKTLNFGYHLLFWCQCEQGPHTKNSLTLHARTKLRTCMPRPNSVTQPAALFRTSMSLTTAGRWTRTLIDAKGRTPPRDFKIFPGYFTLLEQRVLLETALHKLDSTESRQFRRRKSIFFQNRDGKMSDRSSDLQDLFAPDDYYQMQEVYASLYLLFRRF